mgnify:CR=1 FL=1
MSRKTVKGTIGEHKAIIQLMEDGYHVARSVDPQCPFDLVAVGEDGDVKLIDVKTVAIRKKIKPNWTIKSKRVNRVLTAIQKKMGVEHLMVDWWLNIYLKKYTITQQPWLHGHGLSYMEIGKEVMATKNVDTVLIYGKTELPADDVRVKFTNKQGKEYNVELTRLIQVFNNNIWENKKSVR